MTYSDFVGVCEWIWVVSGLLGLLASSYLIRRAAHEEHRWRSAPAAKGRERILARTLVINEFIRGGKGLVFFFAGLYSASLPNATVPTSQSGPILLMVLTLVPIASLAQSVLLIWAYTRIDRYRPTVTDSGQRHRYGD